jgi:hypothetical protein
MHPTMILQPAKSVSLDDPASHLALWLPFPEYSDFLFKKNNPAPPEIAGVRYSNQPYLQFTRLDNPAILQDPQSPDSWQP